MDYQKQRAVTKPRNQFHDLFHDIRGRNSFHATRFSTSLSPSSASSSSPSSPCPLFPPCSNRTHRRIVRRPERIRVQEIEEQVDQDPRNLVIGTLIPSSFLHRPRRRLAARSLAPAGVESHDEGTRFKGPNVSHRVPLPSPLPPYPLLRFPRLHVCIRIAPVCIRRSYDYRDASIESTVSNFLPPSCPSIGKLVSFLTETRGRRQSRKFNRHLSIYYRSSVRFNELSIVARHNFSSLKVSIDRERCLEYIYIRYDWKKIYYKDEDE